MPEPYVTPSKEQAALQMAIALKSAMEGIPIEVYMIEGGLRHGGPQAMRSTQYLRYTPELIKGSVDDMYSVLFEYLGGEKPLEQVKKERQQAFKDFAKVYQEESADLEHKALMEERQRLIEMQNTIAGYEFAKKHKDKLSGLKNKSPQEIAEIIMPIVEKEGGYDDFMNRAVGDFPAEIGAYPTRDYQKAFAKTTYELLAPESKEAKMSDEEFDEYILRRTFQGPVYNTPPKSIESGDDSKIEELDMDELLEMFKSPEYDDGLIPVPDPEGKGVFGIRDTGMSEEEHEEMMRQRLEERRKLGYQ
jgi:hypothetical protein